MVQVRRMRVVRLLFWVLVNVLAAFFALVICLVRLVKDVRFVRLIDYRIGHFAMNTEIFLRRIRRGKIDGRTLYVGIARRHPCNEQLLRMFERNMVVWRLPNWVFAGYILQALAEKRSLLSRLGYYFEPEYLINEYEEMDAPSTLKFTSEELSKGGSLLRSMGIPQDSWFVCFHARDKEYLAGAYAADYAHHSFRDCDVENYLGAARLVARKGGYAIRMGQRVAKPLEQQDPRIIDYATKHRTDFGDIFLPAKCAFFLGNTAGIFNVASVFNVPVAEANVVPLKFPPMRRVDLFIPMKIWSESKGRFLTFREIVNSDVIDYVRTEQYVAAGLRTVQNSAEEIEDLAQEMLMRLEGSWKETRRDRELQRKFREIFPVGAHCAGFPSRIGAKFLRGNEALLQ